VSWGDRVPGRVSQRGGDDGEWIDVRPRRRKARRQEALGQDRFHGGDRLRNRDDYKLRESRVRNATWDASDYTGSDFSDRQAVRWGDCDIEDDRAYYSDRREKKVVTQTKSRKQEQFGFANRGGAAHFQ
jgi:hypothetical protein